MSTVTINQLFDTNRFPAVGFQLVVFMLYFPFGVLLAMLRIFIGLHAYIVAWVLPKDSLIRRVVLRVMCGILGIIVVQEEQGNHCDKSPVLIANYTSPVDRLAIEILFPSVMPSMWDLPLSLTWLLGYEEMGAKLGRETLIQNAKKHCRVSHYPLLAFPEGATTNGKVGLLKFSVWPFSLDEPVQPIVVRIKRPSVTPLPPSLASSFWWSDLFWFLFVPYTCFKLRILPSEKQVEDETVQEFAVRVQKLMAVALNITATSFTSSDKTDFLKQQAMSSHHNAGRNAPDVKSEIELMLTQVHSVLPHIPDDIIRQDLCLTKDVDLTITNLLEGRGVFVANQETERDISPPAPKPVHDSSATFGRTSTERHLTLAERKQELLDNARQRYLHKHAML